MGTLYQDIGHSSSYHCTMFEALQYVYGYMTLKTLEGASENAVAIDNERTVQQTTAHC